MSTASIVRGVSMAVVGLSLAALAGCDGGGHQASTTQTSNILFIIMDDVGIDQMQIFGYGGETPPRTPNIDQIARHGVRFHNTWAMPACTTSRAVFFDGRWPVRTNVYGALGPADLANSQVSPYETTAPKLLAQRGYESALFGKFHLALQENNPAGYAMPYALGWNFFAGWLDYTGDPSSIDTTAGGVAPAGMWPCGFVGGAAQNGADAGPCYMADGTCTELASNGSIPPGRTCRDRGGIFDPATTTCQTPAPAHLDFQTLSGHYVSPLVFNYPDGSCDEVLPTDPRARRFRATVAVDQAIEWINQRPAGQPWMATVSFASAHTPVMQPPVDQDPDAATSSGLNCAEVLDQRVTTNLMIESLDTEVGRLLVETGLARRGRDGQLIYRPGQTGTMVFVVGDNGSLGNTVKEPFDVSRAKGTAYQTGVWVPLVVAGPLVRQPDRIVRDMVNIADLFALFGEIAGIDVAQAVPRKIDSMPMLPYLTNPGQHRIRSWNFTQVGPNLQANGASNGPCTISKTCTQIPVTKSVCHDNNGTWWGEEPDDTSLPPQGLMRCCDVNAYLTELGQTTYAIAPDYASAVRNARYKLVQNTTYEYLSQEKPCARIVRNEFYEINEDVPDPLLDREEDELPLHMLSAEQQRNFDQLSAQLQTVLATAPDCPGDGNIDFAVNDEDLSDWSYYSQSYGFSSVYDLTLDGLTNDADRTVIADHLGLVCSDN